ncbi:hypothetical protein L9F63_013512, partial [Diploptera punctata]
QRPKHYGVDTCACHNDLLSYASGSLATGRVILAGQANVLDACMCYNAPLDYASGQRPTVRDTPRSIQKTIHRLRVLDSYMVSLAGQAKGSPLQDRPKGGKHGDLLQRLDACMCHNDPLYYATGSLVTGIVSLAREAKGERHAKKQLESSTGFEGGRETGFPTAEKTYMLPIPVRRVVLSREAGEPRNYFCGTIIGHHLRFV